MTTVRIKDRVLDSEAMRLTPRMNEPAPLFEANTTHGRKCLTDYRGHWLLLFSHPADFTPICTSEFLAFTAAFDEFKALDCALLGLSVDSNFSHLAWITAIKEKFGVDIPFAIIDDASMWVASMYGMIQPCAAETAAVRASFIIDPEGMLRMMMYYPIGVGRSVRELLRIVAAMQVVEKHGVVTPEGWQPGDKVIVPPPATAEELKQRPHAGYEYTDWYFCKREL
ncbi:MAG: peroxiredoxin [Phycisphaerae bacterium]